MVTIAKQPNAKIMQLLQLYPATDKPTLHPHFMEPTGIARRHHCGHCQRDLAFSIPASNLAVCTACGWTFCHVCGEGWVDSDEARATVVGCTGLPQLSPLEYYVRHLLVLPF
jgi:hypothetical protein